MSATILWEPVRRNPKHIPTGCPSRFVTAMNHFGSSPWELDIQDVGTEQYLLGLAVAGLEGAEGLLQVLRDYGKIRVWTEY